MVPRIMWRRLTLTAKLFVAITAALLVVVLIIAGAVTIHMRDGFASYLLNAEMGRLDLLHDLLENADDADRGWPSLRDEKTWDDLVKSSSPEVSMPPPPPFELTYNDRPPPPPPPRRPDALGLRDRLVLEDASNEIVAGRTDRTETSIARTLAAPGGRVIGYLRLYEPQGIGAPVGELFGARELRTFGLILALAVLLSALVAWLLARQASRPIRALGESVSRLAAGDFEARIPITRSDEVGQLMRDHNKLAESLQWSRVREREWITDASHELKTPLAILRAEIEAMQDGIRQPTPDTLARLHATVMRLSRLVSDLNQSMSHVPGDTDHVRVDLAALMRDAVKDCEARIKARGLTITTALSSPVQIHGDPGRLRQVMDNLLENTCRYTQAPGRIHVACESRKEIASMIVEDSAPAPAPDALPRLFDRFFRGEASRARTLGGSGLGLAICRSIVETHHGKINAERSDLGGLKITVKLPTATRTENG